MEGEGMDNRTRNIIAALDEPLRFARHAGLLYYRCELGPVYVVPEGRLHEAVRADTSLSNIGTEIVAIVPGEALAGAFEIGDGSDALSPVDEAIDAWATYCDEHAATRGTPPPSGPRVKVPFRSAAANTPGQTASA
jgi:hypothetical protein